MDTSACSFDKEIYLRAVNDDSYLSHPYINWITTLMTTHEDRISRCRQRETHVAPSVVEIFVFRLFK
jgi:hypothetical protein